MMLMMFASHRGQDRDQPALQEEGFGLGTSACRVNTLQVLEVMPFRLCSQSILLAPVRAAGSDFQRS